MKLCYCWIAFCACLALSSCCGTLALPQPTYINVPRDSTYPSWRWIGIKRDLGAGCPAAAGWKVDPLFDLDALPAQARRRAVSLGLDAYCLYQSDRRGRDLPVATIRGLQRIEPDPMALVIAAPDDLHRLTAPSFETDFAVRVGRAVLPPVAGAPRVRLVLLDTQPTGEGVPAPPASDYRSPHGYALANIAGRLTSNGQLFENRSAEIATRLAMPYVHYDAMNPQAATPDLVHGGFVGSIGGLAQAVFDELAAWETRQAQDCYAADPACRRGQHLVLNLSLGWETKFTGGELYVKEMQAAVQSVRKVLELAACRGVLIVAAAGNRQGGPDAATGPVLPAGWASQAAASGSELAGKPFLYAVGGVQAQSFPLASSRLGGVPSLSAYGDHAVVRDRDQKPTATLTGTSVSAVVVSAAAAVVWQNRPELTADQVMAVLYNSGDSLKDPTGVIKQADFYPAPSSTTGTSSTGAPPAARRIWLCRALASVCPGCSPSPCLPAEPDHLAERLSAFQPAAAIDAAVMSAKLSVLPAACRAPALYYRPSDWPTFPCPFEQLPSMTSDPETMPQPGADPCPACPITGEGNYLADVQTALFAAAPGVTAAAAAVTPAAPSGRCVLHIQIPRDWKTPLQATNLEINRVNGLDENAPVISYAIDQPLIPGQSLDIHGLDLMGGQTATLNFVSQPWTNGPWLSIESPVYIDCPTADPSSQGLVPAPQASSAERRPRR
jgi:hypothetical protein